MRLLWKAHAKLSLLCMMGLCIALLSRLQFQRELSSLRRCPEHRYKIPGKVQK